MAEKVSGQDLNWFFNQWFLDSGHPELEVEKSFKSDTLTISIIKSQDLDTAPLYHLPISIEIWQNENKETHTLVLDGPGHEFEFYMDSEPEVVIIDQQNNLLADVKYAQSKKELIHQYQVATSALTRFKALEKLLEDSVGHDMVAVFVEALEDPFWAIRQLSVNVFEGFPGDQSDQLISKLNEIAKTDPKSLVRADAITTLSSFSNDELYIPVYLEAMKDSSYAVAGAGLTAYLQLDHHEQDEIVQRFENESNIQLVIPLADYYALNHIPEKYTWYTAKLSEAGGELMYYLINYYGQYLVGSAPEEQISGAAYLEDLGVNHSTYYVRFSAFQALGLLEGVEGVSEMRQRVKQSEKDPRLLEVYAQIP
jgi:aminopeptidase N